MPNVAERGAPDIIRNLADAYQIYNDLVNSACSEIMLLLPASSQDRADVLHSTLRSLEDASKRGVQVRVLTTASIKLPVNSGVTVRHIYGQSGTERLEILIVDRKTH